MLSKGIYKLIREAVQTSHFKERLFQRFQSHNISPEFDIERILPAIKFIEKVNFPGQTNIGIRAFRSTTTFTAKVPDKDQYSRGNNIWVVVRANEMRSIFFEPDGVAPQNVQYSFTIKELEFLVNMHGYDLDHKHLDIKKYKDSVQGTRTRGPQLELPSVIIKGKKWYIDAENEKLIYAKNTKKTMSMDDAFKEFDEEDLEKVVDAMETSGVIHEQFDVGNALEFIRQKEGRAFPKKYVLSVLKSGDISGLSIPEDLGDDEELNFIYKILYAPNTLTKKELHVKGSLDLEDCTLLRKLPRGLSVDGFLYLNGCTSLRELPKGFSVGGWLYFKSTDPIPQKFGGDTRAIKRYIEKELGGKIKRIIWIIT